MGTKIGEVESVLDEILGVDVIGWGYEDLEGPDFQGEYHVVQIYLNWSGSIRYRYWAGENWSTRRNEALVFKARDPDLLMVTARSLPRKGRVRGYAVVPK